MLLKWISKGSEVDYTANGGIWGICGGFQESWGSIGDGFSIRNVLELMDHDDKKKKKKKKKKKTTTTKQQQQQKSLLLAD